MTEVKRKGRAKQATTHALREIYVGSAAKASEPVIIERDEVERSTGGPFRGRLYFWWMEHSDDGGCQRDPVADPHEDLAYVGKTIRDLVMRWLEHLAPGKIVNGERVKNNSAVYRHRALVTGVSADPRVYDTPEALAAAEVRAIKALWPAWNIQEQDRRNPHTRATRAYRRPDRLAPLVGLASVMWGLMWAAVTALFLGVAWHYQAPWYFVPAMPFLALYLVNGTAYRHASNIALHKERRARAYRKRNRG